MREEAEITVGDEVVARKDIISNKLYCNIDYNEYGYTH